MEGYKEKFPRIQDAFLPYISDENNTDNIARNFHELVICARSLGRYYHSGYRDSSLNLPPDFIPGEESTTLRLIRHLMENGRELYVHVGEQTLLRQDAQGIFRQGEVILITDIPMSTEQMPLLGNAEQGYVSIEDFCSNLYFDGVVEMR